MSFKQVPNKIDFIAQEHDTLKYWKENKSFEKSRELRKGKPRWSFIDGPITANNPMGVHHGWGADVQRPLQSFLDNERA